jgi:tRNA pseudouridine38-40 synthase
MPHWKLILTYDGTPYNGWQIQPSLPTVQGTLAQAIHRITGETVLPQGSGRTDTGVHALAQVATFSLSVPIPGPNLHHALNRALPSSIRVLAVERVPEDFHARHSVLRKTYEYRILPGDRICSPMLAPYVWACRTPLELEPLQQAALQILGTRDFTSFAANDPDQTSRNKSLADVEIVRDLQEQSDKTTIATLSHSVSSGPLSTTATITPHPDEQTGRSLQVGNFRTIYQSAWRLEDDLFIYRVTGSGFLHHMVRNLMGTFVETSSRHLAPDTISRILAARHRSAAGPTAPARGLFLVEVEY